MRDQDKTKEQLINELLGMRQKVSALERAEVDRKRTEQSLQQANDRLELALKAGSCGLWEFNVQTGEALFSQQRAEMLGYSMDELEPHVSGWGRLVHPEDIPRVVEALNEHLGGRSAFYESQHRLRCKSGEWKWILARGRVVEFDKEGKPLRFVGTSLDITHRKELEEALIAERERLGRILRLNPAVIYTAKPYGDYGVTFISDNITGLLGYEAREVLEDSSFWASRIHPEDVQEVFEGLSPLFEQGHHVHEYRFHLKEGGYRWIRDEMNVIRDENGTPVEVMGYWIDITDRKRAEKALRKASQELEIANNDLKDFAYIVSHDLKAPLRAASQLVRWLASDYAHAFDDAGKENLGLLLSRVSRMHNLIDSILHYSRLGRTRDELTEVDLNRLISEVIEMVAPPPNITITVEDTLPLVMCEETRIQELFQNLLDNAIKYVDKPEGQIRIGCIRKDSHWQFSVSDNGPGIEEKYHEKIFQIFQTLQSRDELESTGIGLTVVKKIVELHGGKVWVESPAGSGATFFFTLPIRGEEA